MESPRFELVKYDPVAHRSFVFSAFLTALRKHEEFRGIPSPVFFSAFHQVLEHVTDPTSEWNTLVATVVGGADDFAGFIIFKEDLLFWIYAARPYRRVFGCGRMLLEASGCLIDGRIQAVMRPRDWTYRLAEDKGLKVVNHWGELAKMLVGMWWGLQPLSVRQGGHDLEGWRG